MPRDRTGVIVGNTLTGEHILLPGDARLLAFVRRGLLASLRNRACQQ